MQVSPVFLEGEKVNLRPLLKSDANGSYPNWLNDADVCRGSSHHVFPYTKEQADNYIQQSTESNNALILAIVDKQSSTHIGNIALQKINWLYRKAEFAILLGDKSYWSKGVGTEAGLLVIKHGFKAMNLNRIECATFSNNLGMIKLAQKLGMQAEGVRKQAAFTDGEFVDIHEFGLLNESYA